MLKHDTPSPSEPPETQPSRLPAKLAVFGELAADQDIAIDGRFDGQIAVPDHHVSINRSASVRANIVARSVTILGSLEGTIVASEVVEVQAGAWVRGHVRSQSIRLVEGAHFTGTIDHRRPADVTDIAHYRRRE